MNLYVYYDIEAREASALAPAVRAMQAELAKTSGIAGRLMKRPQTGGARETWMEVYEDVDDRFEAQLDRAAATIDWRDAGLRHVERFVDC